MGQVQALEPGTALRYRVLSTDGQSLANGARGWYLVLDAGVRRRSLPDGRSKATRLSRFSVRKNPIPLPQPQVSARIQTAREMSQTHLV